MQLRSCRHSFERLCRDTHRRGLKDRCAITPYYNVSHPEGQNSLSANATSDSGDDSRTRRFAHHDTRFCSSAGRKMRNMQAVNQMVTVFFAESGSRYQAPSSILCHFRNRAGRSTAARGLTPFIGLRSRNHFVCSLQARANNPRLWFKGWLSEFTSGLTTRP